MKRLCVFCGSSMGKNPVYVESARQFGELMHRRGIGLVYGGGGVGLMGAIARTIMDAGGEAIGVIPEFLMERELAHFTLSQLHIVKSMHERKAMMADLSDGFVALPGGLGTLEEFAEIVTWVLLGLHNKPCALLNVNGYFDSFINFINHTINEGFFRPNREPMFLVETDAEKLIEQMMRFSPHFKGFPIDREKS